MEVKGIIHAHSTYSYDAKLTLAELRALFLSHGLKFACMTEHTDELTDERAAEFVAECDARSDNSFRFIPGFEVPYGHAHVLMIGARRFHGTYAPRFTELLTWTREAPFVVLAHPVRNGFRVDSEFLEVLDGIEVWNQQYEGKRVPRPRSLRLFEELRHEKPSLVATAGIDFHRREHLETPIVTLDVERLDTVSVIEKLKEGAFTFSSSRLMLYGTLPDAAAVAQKYQLESALSVSLITLGKFVNKVFASVGLSLPRPLRAFIRRRI